MSLVFLGFRLGCMDVVWKSRNGHPFTTTISISNVGVPFFGEIDSQPQPATASQPQPQPASYVVILWQHSGAPVCRTDHVPQAARKGCLAEQAMSPRLPQKGALP